MAGQRLFSLIIYAAFVVQSSNDGFLDDADSILFSCRTIALPNSLLCEVYPQKIRYFKRRLAYYSNHETCFSPPPPFLVNIHLNPGPGSNLTQNQKESFKRKLSCISLNSRSIVNKRLELSSLLALKPY